jgi:hypothetical protein
MRKSILLSLAALVTMAFTGSADADDISVTIYNSNLGVVHETRDLNFDKGTGRVLFKDVPSLIDPTSVGFELVDKSKSAVILEQNYAYDLVSPEKIYSKYVDRSIDLFDKEGNIFTGELLSFSGGAFVLKQPSGKIQIVRLEHVVHAAFPELPEGLITRPTLFWLYNSDFAGKAACKVSYQTSGMNWTAEYVGILSEDEKQLGLTGWSSITNNSGATYNNATLKLIAGDIHRAARPVRAPRFAVEEDLMAMKASAAGFEEKEFFEYHLYTLPRRATIADREIKQIALFEPATTSVEKEYYYQPDRNQKKVKVTVKFTNSTPYGLGIPLPAGRTRVFKADTDGSMILLGEDQIDHTPKDEEVKLTIGFAFDISAEEKVVDYQKVSTQVEERTFEIELRNHKDEDITIIVEKKLYGDWSILRSNYDFTRKDATTVEFQVPVKANDKAVISFVARTSR